MFNSLRSRLIAVYLGVIILGFGGLTLWAANQVARSTYDDFGAGLQIRALSLAGQLAEPLDHNPDQAMTLLTEAAARLDARVEFFDSTGRLAMSTADSAGLPIDPTQPYERRQEASGEELFIAAAPVREENAVVGLVQIAVPAEIPLQTVRQRWLALAAGMAAFSLLSMLISLWILGSIERPLARLRQSALQIAGGDLAHRVPDLSLREVDEVGHAFNEMAERVEAMVGEQRTFASNASHELRTPLTTILLRAESLRTGELDQMTSEKYAGEIVQEAQEMGHLVEDLLLLSRLDANELQIGHEQIDAARLLKSLQRELASRAEDRQIDLAVSTSDQEMIVEGNLNHVRVVFRNVLDNALKFTPEGGSVRATLTASETSVVLRVMDDGRGIAAEDLPHVGRRFYRADKARSRAVPGTGLGLALSRSILDLYHGTLNISSEGAGRGTAVEVIWPARSDSLPSAFVRAPRPTATAAK